MPYLKFDSPKGNADNKGSCSAFINYLSKEDFTDKHDPLAKEFLFNHSSNLIPDYVAINSIDNNRKGLGKNDAKFYSGSINFSEEELQFIGNDSIKIKEYSVKVMEQYAQNFNRGITIDDLNWFAKIEQNRYFKGDDPEVIAGNNKQGEVKNGLNTHTHFIVGRKTLDGRKKISPKTNHRDTQNGPVMGGFNRDEFKQQCETIFDEMFAYLRPLEQTYNFNKIRINGTVDEKFKMANKYANELVKKETYSKQSTEQKEYRIKQLANYICFGIDKNNPKKLDVDALLRFEQITDHSGYVYRSLVNLNRAFKQGKIPQEFDLTDKVLGFASYLETKEDSNSIPEQPKPIVILNDYKEELKGSESFPDFYLPSSFPNSNPDNHETDALRKKKIKKKKRRDFGMGM